MISLGLNYTRTHDSSACIVRDGELLFAVAEERLSRVKHDGRFPRNAIQACLEFARVRPEQLDEVCFGWQTAGPGFRHDLKCMASGQMPLTNINLITTTMHFLSMWHQGGGTKQFSRDFPGGSPRFRFVDHHLAHALSAYSYSGFDDAAVVVVDGRGAWEATSVWHGHNGRLEQVLTINWPDSLGLFYAAFTEYLGFVPFSDEWKVMGLAPYGQAGIDLRFFMDANADPYHVHSKYLFSNGAQFHSFISRLGPPRVSESEIDDRHKNIAFAVQEACESAMMSVVRLALRKTGSRNLCLAGGVALNSKANGKIQASNLVDKIFVQPAASDDGVALGAALAPYLDHNGCLPMRPLRHAYLGPSFDDDMIEAALQTSKYELLECPTPLRSPPSFLPREKLLAGIRGEWNLARALSAAALFLPIPAIPK